MPSPTLGVAKGPLLVALAVFVLIACGKKVATVRVGRPPSTNDVKLEMPTGRAIAFDVYVDKHDRDGENELRLQVSLLKGGNVVATKECTGMRFSGRSTSGCQATSMHNCPITAPEGGADTVRIETRIAATTRLVLDGVEVRIRER